MSREPTEHDLKIWREPFGAVWGGVKMHEIRKNDRDFRVGDVLHLREWDHHASKYTGQSVFARVTYTTEGPAWDLPAGLMVMSIVVFAWHGVEPTSPLETPPT